MIEPTPTPSVSVLRYDRSDPTHTTVAVAVAMELILAGVSFKHSRGDILDKAELAVQCTDLPAYIFESLVNKIYGDLEGDKDD